MNGWIIYDKPGAERNRWFTEHFINTAKKYGHHLKLVICDEIAPPYPDFAVVRCFDFTVNKRLEQNGVRVFNNSFLAQIANNKILAYKYLSENGVDILPTFYEVPENPVFPLVVKAACGHGGTEVFLVNNTDELSTAVKKIQLPVIQSVASDIGKDLRVYVMKNKIIIAMLRNGNGDFRSNYCLGGTASVYSLSNSERIIIEKIISLFDIDFAGIDFVFNDGKLVFNEIEDAVGSRMLYDLTDIDIIDLWFNKIL